MSQRPRVSIAVPVYNAAGTIDDAIGSALSQTYEDIEVVVVDNASTDATAERIAAHGDPRLRLHRNEVNIGAHRNANRSVELSRGELVKFLHADDVLYPHCVERMVEALDAHPRAGLAFARRRIEIGDESNPDWLDFREVYTNAVRDFGGVEPINDGRALLCRWLEAGFSHNWIGEPSSVMMRRSALERIGLFNPRVRMITDVEMWARTMLHHDVAFVDEELSAYRFHAGNLTTTQGVVARWLDRLWLLEGLAATLEDEPELPGLSRALADERVRVGRHFARLVRRDPSMTARCVRDAVDYLAFNLRRRFGRAPALHPSLPSLVSH